MSLKKTVLLSASIMTALAVSAQSPTPLLESAPKKTVKQINMAQPDFGGYKVERKLKYVPVSQIGQQKVIKKTQSMAIVETASQTTVTKNTVVRNILTGELAPLSGNINVLLKDGVTADQVSSQLGLTLVVSYPNTKLAVFKASPDADVIEVAAAIKSSGLVKSARIEVLETIYQAD
ncbi:S8 family serine peptidase [Pleionea mediterranea]|uniref:ASP external chaperone domain-containing protein n=1 Tax=Pleionea mediterranea TaxID=523701 RepID=A0A316G379_9GAMM|nr:hypothetical protein [Pleionea mediterranea]PWK54366.1 hypothetical protein C8D97_101214 [Pleionea mediterranea]